MKRLAWSVALVVVLGGTMARLVTRWREEAADKNVSTLVDWVEVRDSVARQGIPDEMLLETIRSSGVDALLIGASLVKDYLARAQPSGPLEMTFSSRALADAVCRQLENRGVTGVSLQSQRNHFKIVNSSKSWEDLKEMELGFNPEFLGKVRQAGFHAILRINNDPWLTKEQLFSDLQEINSGGQELGFLLNTDEFPGGPEALLLWASFLESQSLYQLLFEFKPSKSSLKVGRRTPQSTFRAHTIATSELKDMSPAREKSRWIRAVQERSCRFLLFHMTPNDTLTGFLTHVAGIHQELTARGWTIGWPAARVTWTFPSFPERRLAPIVALLFAIIVPIIALRLAMGKSPWLAYLQIFSLTLIGACVVASIAQNPLTRVQIIPFRGIKLAFLIAWAACFVSLFSWDWLEQQLFQSVRRVDVLIGLLIAAAAGYLLLRTGNAGAGWQAGSEQVFRDKLEALFHVRPRFKEFAIGYPLLLAGLHLQGRRSAFTLGRLLIAVGMLAPISVINTFCHLHSPLYLAFWRSMNGFLLGTVLGLVLLKCGKWLAPAREH